MTRTRTPPAAPEWFDEKLQGVTGSAPHPQPLSPAGRGEKAAPPAGRGGATGQESRDLRLARNGFVTEVADSRSRSPYRPPNSYKTCPNKLDKIMITTYVIGGSGNGLPASGGAIR